jgi:uncharacterized membrane protein YkvI
MQFFVFAGPVGFAGIALSSILFFYLGNLIMQMAYRSRTSGYHDLLRKAFGKSAWYRVFDVLITTSYFGVLVVMTSGAGALFAEFIGLPFWAGGLLILIPTFLTVLMGRGAVIMAISSVVPLVLVGIALITLFTLWQHPLSLDNYAQIAEQHKNTISRGSPLVAALLYSGYNILLTLAVLTVLGQTASESKSIRAGAFLGVMGLSLASIFIFAALASTLQESSTREIPMLYLASQLHPFLAFGYGAVLFLEIYTSTLGLLYGLVERLFKLPSCSKARKNLAPAILFICTGALLCSFFGFSNMVSSVYPLLGIGSVLFCILLWRRRQSLLNKKLF